MKINWLQVVFAEKEGVYLVRPRKESWTSIEIQILWKNFVFFILQKKHKQVWFFLEKKNPQLMLWVSFCGERGIRTPGPVTVNSFQDYRIRPLCHFSSSLIRYSLNAGANIDWIFNSKKQKSEYFLSFLNIIKFLIYLIHNQALLQ